MWKWIDPFSMFMFGIYVGNVILPRKKYPQVLISILVALAAILILQYR